MANGSPVLVTDGAGLVGRRVARRVTGAPIPVEHVPVGNGEMPAVVVDISAARAIGYRPVHDLDTGMATVWPDFDANHPGARAAETRA
jgi:nucleoside-diphosphate-sugar epimerase